MVARPQSSWSSDHDTTIYFAISIRNAGAPRPRSRSAVAKFPSGIERRAGEPMLSAECDYAYRRRREYLNAPRTSGRDTCRILRPRPVAYFSTEFSDSTNLLRFHSERA